MSNGLILLSLAGLMIGVSQVINKKLSSTGHDSKTYTAVIMLANALISVPLLFYQFALASHPKTWLLIFVSIVVYAFSTHLSFRAYQQADVSTVAIVQRTSIVFIALFGILLFHETYTLPAYLGLVLVFASGLTLAYKGRRLEFGKGVVYAFLAAITGAIASVLDKAVLNDFSAYTYVFVNNLLVGLVFAFDINRIKEAKKLFCKHYVHIFLTALLWTGAFLLVSLVLQQNDVSRTMPVYKSLGLITPVALGILFLKERTMIREKFLGILLGTVGIILLYWR